jgi:hypothetical protein
VTAAGEGGASGVKRIVYSTDGNDPAIDSSDNVTNGTEVAGASASFNLSAEGVTTVKWIAEDNVGNITSSARDSRIGRSPQTTVSRPADPSNVDPDVRLLVERGWRDIRNVPSTAAPAAPASIR